MIVLLELLIDLYLLTKRNVAIVALVVFIGIGLPAIVVNQLQPGR